MRWGSRAVHAKSKCLKQRRHFVVFHSRMSRLERSSQAVVQRLGRIHELHRFKGQMHPDFIILKGAAALCWRLAASGADVNVFEGFSKIFPRA